MPHGRLQGTVGGDHPSVNCLHPAAGLLAPPGSSSGTYCQSAAAPREASSRDAAQAVDCYMKAQPALPSWPSPAGRGPCRPACAAPASAMLTCTLSSLIFFTRLDRFSARSTCQAGRARRAAAGRREANR